MIVMIIINQINYYIHNNTDNDNYNGKNNSNSNKKGSTSSNNEEYTVNTKLLKSAIITTDDIEKIINSLKGGMNLKLAERQEQKWLKII